MFFHRWCLHYTTDITLMYIVLPIRKCCKINVTSKNIIIIRFIKYSVNPKIIFRFQQCPLWWSISRQPHWFRTSYSSPFYKTRKVILLYDWSFQIVCSPWAHVQEAVARQTGTPGKDRRNCESITFTCTYRINISTNS